MKNNVNRIAQELTAWTEKHPEAVEELKPTLSNVTKELNQIAFTNDIIVCFLYDLDLLQDDRVALLLKKYGLGIERSKEFPALYAKIQALLRPPMPAPTKEPAPDGTQS